MVRLLLAIGGCVSISHAALAGFLPPEPLPLAGVTGPVGMAVAAAAYGAYWVYKHYN
jgi:hypothetical protein